MIDARLYLLQRLTAIAMLPLIATHLILMIFAINGGLTAEEILGRTRMGTVLWLICSLRSRSWGNRLQNNPI